MIIAAPMAGGPTTPALVRAIAQAGAHKGCFGFLASGNLTPEQLASDIAAVGDATFGVNFFMPQAFVPTDAQLEQAKTAVITHLSTLAASENTGEGLGVAQPGLPAIAKLADFAFKPADLSNQFEEKFAIALDSNASVLSSSFGYFDNDHIRLAHERGKKVWVSVTSVAEARAVVLGSKCRVDALIVQGHEAGGHRLSWEIDACPNNTATCELVAEVKEALVAEGFPDLMLVAAGGVRTGSDVRALLDAGAAAVSCGSVFLLADEAGTSTANRQLLQSHRDVATASVSTRGFSGRIARGVPSPITEYTNHGHSDVRPATDDFPPVYPYLSQLSKLIVGGYCLSGDPAGLYALPAGDILARLIDESGI